MAISLPGSITGAAQTGFTTPGYTTTPDQAPDTNARQVAVTAITGTQAGVDVSSVARPFTLAFFRPKVFSVLGKPNPVTGLIADVPLNNYKLVVRKGLLPLLGQPNKVGNVTVTIGIPAGADVADPANVRALLSAAIGALSAISAGIGDTAVTGVM